jgi:hypothetical protein
MPLAAARTAGRLRPWPATFGQFRRRRRRHRFAVHLDHQHLPVLLTLALVTAGAGVTVMLSGYLSGGQLAFPLAAGLAGAAAASLALAKGPDLGGAVGVAVVGLFALLVVALFFGDLTNANAVLLFAAPLLGWLPELLPARRVGPRARGVVRVVLAAVPVAVVLALAVQKFNADSAPRSSTPGANAPSVEDYMNFGK